MAIDIAVIILTYLIGSLSSAIIVCKLWRLPDPRQQGSKNPGATNVLRIGGKTPAVITMLGDGCKGFLPTLIVTQLGFPNWVIGSVMLAALLGHIFPIFFGFKGGKGVATAMGSYLGLSWVLGAILIATWAGVILITRISSLGAIVATILTPFAGWFLLHDPILTGAMCLMSLILLYRHKSNFIRLFSGNETKV
jgi:glycerol-3-phosphate acyltransferase PlsY